MDSHPLSRAEHDARLWGMLSHLTALLLYVGIPFGNILGPLFVWLFKKDQIPFVNNQGKESLNFQISMTIYGAVAFALSFALIGIPLLIAVAIVDFVFVILASIEANKGNEYHYPLTIEFIK